MLPVFQAGGQTPKAKPKLQEDGDQRDTMMSMISMASSESTVAGLMSLSVPSTAALMGDKEQGAASGSAQTWTGKGVAEPPPQGNSEVHTPAKVSLSEYRAKNADVLAAQKRKLENMEASVKRDYANAAQALIGQQQRKDKQHQQGGSAYSDLASPSPIILKIPLEKEKHERSALKMRFPAAAGGGGGAHGARGQDPDIKVRIRVPEKQQRGGGGAGEDGGKSRDKHRERSNHHHHPHHHHSSSGGGSLSSHKHSSGAPAGGGGGKKASADSSRTASSSSASRKRAHAQDPPAPGPHPPSKVSKSSRSYQLGALPSGQALGHGPDLLPPQGVPPHHQGGFAHAKGDKLDTNGHGGGGGAQSNEYQDTFEMLNSLLSAQGVQPAQPSVFDYRAQYGDYRYSGGARAGNPRPPPLPSEPPPPLPPLPK